MSSRIANSPHDPNNEQEEPSLDLMVGLSTEGLAFQLEQVKALDSKANFVLGAGTALVSAALILKGAQLSASTTPHSTLIVPHPAVCQLIPNQSTQTLALVLLLSAYLIVITTAYFAYRNRKFKNAPELVTFSKFYLSRDQNTTKKEIFISKLNAYDNNAKIIARKAVYLNLAFLSLVLEALLLVLVLWSEVSC